MMMMNVMMKVMMKVMNGTVVKHWSRTHATSALSTSEAEDYAVITGAAEALGQQSMLMDLGLSAQVRVWTDSNAAKAIAQEELMYLREESK